MSEEINKSRRKPGDPLVYIPGNARINFEPNGQNPPSTKYNSWTLIMDDKMYRDVTGGFYGNNSEDRDRRSPKL